MTTSNASDVFLGAAGKVYSQEFKVSGTFVPSAALLARGGTVFVQLYPGGSSGGASKGSAMPAGHAGRPVEAFVVVTGPTPVVIGSGGNPVTVTTGSAPGLAGSDSTFGTLLTAKGAPAPGSTPIGACGDGAATPAQAWYDGSGMNYRPGYGLNGRGGGGSSNSAYPAVDGGTNSVSGNVTSGTVTGNSAAQNSAGGGGSATNTATPGTATSGAGGTGWGRVTWVE